MEEKNSEGEIYIVPEEEKNPKEMAKTLTYMKFVPALGIIVMLVLIFVWVVPYTMTR